MNFSKKALLAAMALSVFGLPLAQAGIVTQTYSGSYPTTISGTLANENTALEETFTLGSSSSFTAFTSSYTTGGFEPTLTLFTSAGNYIASSNVPGASPLATADPSTGLALDAYLSQTNLASGTYILALTDWELNQAPTATNLSAGFTDNFGDGVDFVDEAGNTRTGAYALTLQTASTPEPATWALILPSIFFLGFLARKRSQPTL